ncbi:MAG TPA: DUF2889 domain-containing protein [Macromonas sp.]|nr:DUF2889 domain-containing protein [Macromonas sp.]
MSMKNWELVRHTPPRAEYGTGVFVRSLAITTPAPGQVSMALEDGGHAFRIDGTYADGIITSVNAVWQRQPFNSCSGATQALQTLVGTPLSSHLFNVALMTDSRQQCTHLFDLFCLAVTHAHRQRADVRYDVVVPDPAKGENVSATLYRNREPALQWSLVDYERIDTPAFCRGVSVLKGFTAWVQAHVPPDEHELYFVMQRALFVARMQKLDMETMVGKPATWSGPPPNSCYGSQSERFSTAVRLDSTRRFSLQDRADPLTFFPLNLSGKA